MISLDKTESQLGKLSSVQEAELLVALRREWAIREEELTVGLNDLMDGLKKKWATREEALLAALEQKWEAQGANQSPIKPRELVQSPSVNGKLELYCVIGLSAGPNASHYPVSYLKDVPAGGWTDEYKTTKLVLRRISAGTFMMGSSKDEVENCTYAEDEKQHRVTLTEDYWIGVFEVTQKQWELVMGKNPSKYKGDSRPVERVSYRDIRGSHVGEGWPKTNSVDPDSFLGMVRRRTGLMADLPTEAQWEYACRAGTTTALNNGKNLTNTEKCYYLAEVGRYNNNGGSEKKHAVVGTYVPNAWGLYDMHGNVWEWCLDWYGEYPYEIKERKVGQGWFATKEIWKETKEMTDPKGVASGSYRVLRGGSWYDDARSCRSACRGNFDPSNRSSNYGFRLVVPIGV